MFLGVDKKTKAPIRRGQMLFCSVIMNNTSDEKRCIQTDRSSEETLFSLWLKSKASV